MGERRPDAHIGDEAARLRNAGDDAGAIAHLETELEKALAAGDDLNAGEALSWLATTLWFAGCQAEGVEIMREAVTTSRRVSLYREIVHGLSLASLMTNLETGPDPRTGSLLEELRVLIAEVDSDDFLEGVRLQRLARLLTKQGQVEEAALVYAEAARVRRAMDEPRCDDGSAPT